MSTRSGISADRPAAEPSIRVVTVAINAQINPGNPGGAESAIQGLLAHLSAQASPTERFVVLSTERYTPDVEQWTGQGQEVVAWPFPQPAFVPFRSMTRRWQRLHRRAGRSDSAWTPRTAPGGTPNRPSPGRHRQHKRIGSYGRAAWM